MTSYARESVSPARIIWHNIAIHFRIRAPSWYMATMTFCVGIALTVNPTLLSESVGAPIYFSHMREIFDQSVWRAMFLVAGTSRLMALAINGSFPTIWWTPHVRVVMSAASVFLWSQIAISVVGGAPTIGTVVYPFIVLIELVTLRQAFKDAWGRDG